MRPERKSKLLLGVTRSKAKMYEYGVAPEHHIKITRDPANLFTLAIGFLGDLAARTNSENVDEEYIKELSESLQFSARFFDSYLQTRLNEGLNPYLLLMGSASYYLCGFPGSSHILAKYLGMDCPDLECLGLEDLLRWLLQVDYSTYFDGSEGLYGKQIDRISKSLIDYTDSGNGKDRIFELTSSLRKTAYANGTPRQLLFADVICAIVKKRFENSTWYSLPRYSDLTAEKWSYALQKETFVRELWPAQHLLGKHGVFRGKSAVVQMPTSAGKTKAAEIIIRSAFLSGRASLAVIVAPFRSLCHEVRISLIKAFQNESVNIDELSDVLQADFEIEKFLEREQVLVVTPEKLIYVLRHAPELAEKIGLLIYDEGHQFDSGTRGITYELLLTSLKAMVPEGVQTVLISAVISNAESVNDWLNGFDSEVVSGTNLIPTYRTVAFASWLQRLGRLYFVTEGEPDTEEFFVPRIIEPYQLKLRPRERKKRMFPEKNDGHSIALYLGLKLTQNGSVAIFCGTKATAAGLCEKVVEAYNRGLPISKPAESSDQKELQHLYYLYEKNLGIDAIATQSANLGIFAHHGNTPHGIRLAVEHAMKEGLVKFVICTSTLAQGVNLPIRYLIVTSVYQGPERIKVRDFHNLIGRAGRSGMHTEGSIIFADPEVYDKRHSRDNKWRWTQVRELLNPENAEPCASSLLTLFSPLTDVKGRPILQIDWIKFVQIYIESFESLDSITEQIVSQYSDRGLTKDRVESQLRRKLDIIASIESYLMANWDESDSGLQEEDISGLAKETLAYFLADEEQEKQIIELFNLLAKNIDKNILEALKRKVFGKTLYGVWTSIAIENWVTQHIEELIVCSDYDELLAILWPILVENIQNNSFRKCDQPDVLKEITSEWIHGRPYNELYEILTDAGAKIIAGTQRHRFKLEHVVDICENALAYDGTLVIGAVVEIVGLISPNGNEDLISNLQNFQKCLKYGLASLTAINLYELGFADRIVAMDLASKIDVPLSTKKALLTKIKKKEVTIRKLLMKYPSYFSIIFENLIA